MQPIIAKQILPWFGGSAGVWTTCLVFFQSVLLAGYAYADLTTRLGARRQALLHVALLAASLAFLPILASSGWKPRGDEEPISRILLLLVVTIGLPYFLLSTTTPLLQSWYWRRFRSAVPYRLFALSNFASLLALLGFPLLFEPAFDLTWLGRAWSVVFVGLRDPVRGHGLAVQARLGAIRSQSSQVEAPSAGAQLQWLALSAMGSVMLLAVTNHITQNISGVPFLWVLPLALYLISFTLAFDHPRWYARPRLRGRPRRAPARDGVLCAVARPESGGAPLSRGPVRDLHVLPWRPRAAPARPAASHALLPRAVAGRGVRRRARRHRGSARAARILRARHRARPALPRAASATAGRPVVGGGGGDRGHGDPRGAREHRVHGGSARDGARLLRGGAHGGFPHAGAVPLDVSRRHHARRPAPRRRAAQPARRLFRPRLRLRPHLHLAARDAPGPAARRGDHRPGRGRGGSVDAPGRHPHLLRDQPARGGHRPSRVHLPRQHRRPHHHRHGRRAPLARARGAARPTISSASTRSPATRFPCTS